MPIDETKFIKTNGYFTGVKPNNSGHHFCYSVDEFGKTKRLVGVEIVTENHSLEIIKRMLAERPWCKENILESLHKAKRTTRKSAHRFPEKAAKLLKEIGDSIDTK